jgi:hypothetical protein
MILMCLLVIPLVSAGNYGAGTYGTDQFNIGETADTESEDTGGSGSGGASGGGGKSIVSSAVEDVGCTKDLHCGTSEYCYEGICHVAECFDDGLCKNDEVCHQYRCVKLFDVEIKEFESPIKLGDFFDFTYLIKGMANFNDDVIISFKIERDGIIVTSGQDVIYLGSFEEKTKKTRLFLPSTVDSGVYTFSVEVTYGNYKAESFRTIEIVVEEGTAKITLSPEKQSLAGSAIGWAREKFELFLLDNLYIILIGFGIFFFGIIGIVLIKRISRKQKRIKTKSRNKKVKRTYRKRILHKLKAIKKDKR